MICVIYHFYSLFSHKNIDFNIINSYNKTIVIRVSNNLNRHIVVNYIEQVEFDNIIDEFPFMTTISSLNPDTTSSELRKYLILENETRDLHIFYNGDLSNLKEINLGFLLMPNNIEYFSENYDSLYEKSLRNFSVNRELTKSEKKIINKIYKK